MKFLIHRTSCSVGAPVPEAKLESYTRIDEHTVDDPLKNPFIGTKWYDQGTNHRVENGRIRRDFIDQAYFIELDLAQLPEFIKQHGRIVISQCYFAPEFLELEIYDDYRE